MSNIFNYAHSMRMQYILIRPFDNYVTHTFWSWRLALFSKSRKVNWLTIHESKAPRPNDVII